MESNSLQKSIMRRVYYTYTISIFTHTMFFQGVFLAVAALLLARWLHVASIIDNFLSVPVGSAPAFVYGSFSNAVSSGELITVLTLVVAGGVAVSVGFKLAGVIASRIGTMSRI